MTPIARNDDGAGTSIPPLWHHGTPPMETVTADDPFVAARVASLRLAQVVTALGTAALAAWTLLVAATPTNTLELTASLLLVSAATVAVFVLPAPWLTREQSIIVPLIDVLGMIVLRTTVAEELPTSVVMGVVPVLWIAAGYRRGPTIAAISAVAVWLVPLVLTGTWPASGWAWVQSLLPLFALLVLTGVAGGAAALYRRQTAVTLGLMREHEETLRLRSDAATIGGSLLEAIDSAIAFYDRDHRLLLSNESAQRFAARERIDLAAPVAADDDLVLDENRHNRVPPEQRVLVAASRGQQLEPRIAWVGPAEDQRAFLKFSRRVDRADGTTLGVLVVAHDVTELLQSRQVRDGFLRVVSHELRTPMTPLVGYLDLLEESLAEAGPVGVEASAHLSIIKRNVDRLLDRMQELLTAADAQPHISRRAADVAAIARAVAVDFDARARQKDVTIAVCAPDVLIAEVDPANLSLALGHLVDNAIKFAPASSLVEISLAHDTEGLRLAVGDRGPGIDALERGRVFDRFYRTEHAHREAVPGFGLGLAVALSVVAGHGGQISIDSRAGGGTVAAVRLPG